MLPVPDLGEPPTQRCPHQDLACDHVVHEPAEVRSARVALAHARGNAFRTQPAALPAHQTRCRIALRTAVHVASGANVAGKLGTSPPTKNPGALSSPGFRCMAWR